MSYIKVKAINLVHAVSGVKPTIVRMNKRSYNRMGKYYVGPTQNKNGTPSKFLQVNDGKHVRYYGNPFWNLYRIVSKSGNDFVIHEAK
jgi:hypothetical protein|tara:strand:- start:4760 stop:5023 length:264 start_codon:yes stop_codon:yes gene_type:complete